MKIGMILEDYYPDDIRVTKEVEALVLAGFEVFLLCMKKEDEKKEEFVNGLHIIRVNLPIKQTLKGLFFRAINAFSFNHPLWTKEIESFIIKYKIDILHIHDLPLFGSANKVVKKLNKKIVIDLHENYPDGLQVWGIWKKDFKNRYIYPILSNYKRWLSFEKLACEQSDRVIVVVSQMQERLEKLHKIWLTEYYLGIAYMINGDLKNAKIYAKKAIAMNPNPPYVWNLLHFINVKYAGLKTGKPVIDFLPSKKDAEKLNKAMIDMGKNIKKKQNQKSRTQTNAK